VRLNILLALAAALPFGLHGCASNPSSASSASGNESGSRSENSQASTENSGKAMKKISMAIGEEIGNFTIAGQQEVEAPTGYNGTQYTVKTKAGKTYKCEILEPSGLGKVATWGMGSGAGAMCTDFTKGSKDKGKTNKASCNPLLQAAGKC